MILIQRIYPQKAGALNEAKRLEIAKLLIKAGYAVKIGIEKPKNTNVYFIEYWDEQTKNDT